MKMEDIVKNEKFTKEDLINYYESGLTIRAVADKLGVDEELIRRRNKYYGINIEDYSRFNKITKEALIKYYSEGYSMSEVSDFYNTTTTTLRKINNNFGINISDYYECRLEYDVHIFDSIDTEEKAYWLGFLYADGCVRSDMNVVALNLNSVDIDHLRKFKKFLKDSRPDSVIRERSKTTALGNPQYMCDYEVCNPHLKQTLINLGCVPRKSLILKFPDIKIFKKSDLVYDFIRGYVDGDGCLSNESRGKRLQISIRGTFDFLNTLISYLPEFTKVYSEIDKRTNTEQHKVSCCSDKADKIAQKLYGHATIYLDRKYNKYATLCRLYNAGEKSNNIGEGCDANTEITSEITKGPEES